MVEGTGAADAQTMAVENLTLLGQPLAGPWPRLWARLFDISLSMLALAALLHGIGPSIFGDQFLMDPSYDPLVGLALLPVALLLDAVIQVVLGNSLGKLIAGIRVETIELKRPRLAQLLNRNLGLWLKGLGLGVPIVSLFAMMACYMTVKSGRLTSWDARTQVRVFSRGSNIYRTLLIFGAVLTLIGGLTAFNAMVPATADAQVAAAVAQANASLPRQIDEQTRMDLIEVDGPTVTYTYTLVDPRGEPSLTPTQLRALKSDHLKRVITQSYCQQNHTIPQDKARYVYRTLERVIVADVTVTPQSCVEGTP